MNRAEILRRRIQGLTVLFMAGLVLSGVTAIPLRWEVSRLAIFIASNDWSSHLHGGVLTDWLSSVQSALDRTAAAQPFLFYGTDWLAFGHFVIAIAFIGALRDPVRNRWLFDFGLIACTLVIPYAFVCGAVREIPVWWRLIDCSFGVFGAVPLWFGRGWTAELEKLTAKKS